MNICNKTAKRNIFHHNLSMFLHYLGKFNDSNLLQSLKKMQTRKFDF